MGNDWSAEIESAMADLAARSPAMARLIGLHGPYAPRPKKQLDVFGALARSIIYQQLAGKAAATIHGRFQDLFDGAVTAEGTLRMSAETLRGAGLSRAKGLAVVDLAHHMAAGEFQLDDLVVLDDRALVDALCRVRGIGPWTVQMFMIFELGRLDVWPTGDLGVRKGYAIAFDRDVVPGPRELEPLGDPFRPYRSVVAWYCWRALDAV